MTKPPKMTAALRKERLAGVSAKREHDMSTSRLDVKAASPDGEVAVSRESEIAASRDGASAPKTLPKVTLYAHQSVLKALRLVAVEDGVQAQEILRRAVRDYLATRGHTFTDLTTGR